MSSPSSEEPPPQITERQAEVEAYFGFSFEAFYDSLRSSIDEAVGAGIDGMEVTLLPSFPLSSERTTLKSANDTLIDHLTSAYDLNFDKFEMYLSRNVFHIPDEVIKLINDDKGFFDKDVATPGKKRRSIKKEKTQKTTTTTNDDDDDEEDDVLLPPNYILPTKPQLTTLTTDISLLLSKVRSLHRQKASLVRTLSLTTHELSKATSASTLLTKAISSKDPTYDLTIGETVEAVILGREGVSEMRNEGEVVLSGLQSMSNVIKSNDKKRKDVEDLESGKASKKIGGSTPVKGGSTTTSSTRSSPRGGSSSSGGGEGEGEERKKKGMGKLLGILGGKK